MASHRELLTALAPYRKTIAACVGALLVTIPLVWDRSVDANEAVALVSTWATALGVYGIANEPMPAPRRRRRRRQLEAGDG